MPEIGGRGSCGRRRCARRAVEGGSDDRGTREIIGVDTTAQMTDAFVDGDEPASCTFHAGLRPRRVRRRLRIVRTRVDNDVGESHIATPLAEDVLAEERLRHLARVHRRHRNGAATVRVRRRMECPEPVTGGLGADVLARYDWGRASRGLDAARERETRTPRRDRTGGANRQDRRSLDGTTGRRRRERCVQLRPTARMTSAPGLRQRGGFALPATRADGWSGRQRSGPVAHLGGQADQAAVATMATRR